MLGARLGLLFGLLCRLTFPGLGVQPAASALVGMSAFFTGVVRAPVTGIVLVIEMTASFPISCLRWVPVTHHYLRRRLKTEPSQRLRAAIQEALEHWEGIRKEWTSQPDQ